MKRTIGLFAIVAVVALTGCARFSSHTKNYVPVLVGTNMVPVLAGETDMIGYSLWDANQALAKAANQSSESGTKDNRYAPGTRIQGLNEQSQSPSAMLDAFVRGLEAYQGRQPAFAPPQTIIIYTNAPTK